MAIDPFTGKEQVTGATQEAKHLANLKNNPGSYTGTFGSSDTTANNRVKAAEAEIRSSQEAAVAPKKEPMSLADRGKQEDIDNQVEFAKLESGQQELVNTIVNDPKSPLFEMTPLRAYMFLKKMGKLDSITSFSQENSEGNPPDISKMLSNIFIPGGSDAGAVGIGSIGSNIPLIPQAQELTSPNNNIFSQESFDSLNDQLAMLKAQLDDALSKQNI